MKYLFHILLWAQFLGYAQHELGGLVLDEADKSPLEFVGIYNTLDHTMTNADGRFLFSSRSDSVIVYRPGYGKLSTTFQNIKDTIYLSKSVLELNEVTVTNAKPLWQKVKDSIKTNYALYPFKEKFLVRCMLRYNGEITRIQDMQGKVERKTLLYTQEIEADKNDFAVELTNMRKVGLVRDENDVYFIFDSFYGLFMSLIPMNATGDAFDLTESSFENNSKIKLAFTTSPSLTNEKTYGHYIINATNNAMERFYMVQEFSDNPFKKSGKSRYRTVFTEREISLKQSPKNSKYYIESSKYNVRVESTDETNTFTSFYDVSFIMTTTDNEGDYEVKKNVSTSKDLFKINHT
ncbi:MAG: hypothetical protein WA810_05840, partial [Maribacter sp.]